LVVYLVHDDGSTSRCAALRERFFGAGGLAERAGWRVARVRLEEVLEARFLDPELCLFELTRRLPPTQGARAAKRALDIECSG